MTFIDMILKVCAKSKPVIALSFILVTPDALLRLDLMIKLTKIKSIKTSNYAEHVANNQHNCSKSYDNLHQCNNINKITALKNFKIYWAVKSEGS